MNMERAERELSAASAHAVEEIERTAREEVEALSAKEAADTLDVVRERLLDLALSLPRPPEER